ncbi:MAG: transposase [Candidatus Heimdallarchaeota archaeon]|nr:transposase [Candidatus Heimdallarchaeota archaeon]MCK4876921.1 transposase [Candidatus Heimdallarchaeota archaeon]
MMIKVLRTEIIEMRKNKELSKLCHLTKNLYNRGNYRIKEELNKNNLLFYNDLDRLLKDEQCYKLLPSHTAQHTLKLLSRKRKSYFAALKEWKKHPNKFLSCPRPPYYKKPTGETIAIFSNQQAKIVNGWLVLPKKIPFTLKTRFHTEHKLREVRIVPRGVGYTIEIIYYRKLPKFKKKKNPSRKGAIDLGLTNLVTFVDNIDSRPIIVKDEGKGVKSITQYYMKKVSKLQEQYAQQQRKYLKQRHRLNYGQAFYRARENWRRKMKDAFHKLSRFLIDLWVERDLHTIVIGYNPKWKQQLRLRRKTTQLFVIIPFHLLIKLLKYKAAEQGIKVELIDESHTSKCSFLDNEPIHHHASYLGKRVKRGLFQSAQGILINADVNAAYNILSKSDPQAFPSRCVGGVGGYVIYPLRVNFQAMML